MAVNVNAHITKARCTSVQIFFRICGHVEHSFKHSAACIWAQERNLTGGNVEHWNPLPYDVKPLYVVGLCVLCLRRLDYDGWRDREPAINVDRGTGMFYELSWLNYEADRLQERALEWRGLVEEDERIPRVEELKKERELITRMTLRELQWNNAWAAHCAANVGVNRAKILDLTDDLTRPRTSDDLLEPYEGEDNCDICVMPLSDASPMGNPNEAPKPARFTTGCAHDKTHHICAISWLVAAGERDCTQCKVARKFVVKNTNDDPVTRWQWANTDINDRWEKVMQQVSGHITFAEGFVDPKPRANLQPGERPFRQDPDSVESRSHFQPYLGEDRWGDSYRGGTP
jgi:hypothetical protein